MTCRPFTEQIPLTSAPGAPIQHARKLVHVGDCAGILRFSGSCAVEALAMHGAHAAFSPRVFDRLACTLHDVDFEATAFEADYSVPVRAGAALHLGQEWHCHKCRNAGWRCQVQFVPAAQQPDPRAPYELPGTLITVPECPQQAALVVLSAHSTVTGHVAVEFRLEAEAPGGEGSAGCELFVNWHRMESRGEEGFQRIDWHLQRDWRIERGESICVLATWTVQRAAAPRWSLRGSFTPLA